MRPRRTSGGPRIDKVLIGREHEQQAIDRIVAGARLGASGVLALTGQPGVGKTALLRWAEDRLGGFRVLRATGTEPEREVPFAGLLSVLRPALAHLDSIAGPQARALAAALALGEGQPPDRFAVGAATLSLVCRYAEQVPLAIVVDDLHLLDRPSAAALLFAARRLDSDPVVVLVAGRAGEVEDLLEGLACLEVAGLGLAAARGLVESVSAAPVTDEWLQRLHELTGGNPLALAELAQDLDPVVLTGSPVLPPLSATLGASFNRRLGQLDDDARTALLVAVVCNGDRRLTGTVCGALGVEAARLEQAHDAGLADVSGAEITFRHPLIRAAVHGGSSIARRRAVHAAVARALPVADLDRRAWHLSEARWAPDAEVADLLEAAAVRAVARAAHAVASAAFERSARLTPGRAEADVRLVAAAESAWAAGQGPKALALLDELSPGDRSDPTGPGPLDLRALELRAAIAVRSGSLREGCALLEAAAGSTPSADRRVLLLAQALDAAFFLADGVTCSRLADELARTVGLARSSRARAVGTIAMGMAKVLTGRGGVEELRAAVPMLAAEPDLDADARGYFWLMCAPLFIRDADTGRGLRARVDAARERAGVGALPGLLFLVARDEATTRAWARAAADYHEAVRLARDTGQTTELAIALAGLSWLESRTGREAECRAHAEEAIGLARERDIRCAEAWALLSLGELALVRGRPEEAVGLMHRLGDLLAGRGTADPDLSPVPELVAALVRLGEGAEADRVSEAFAAEADAKGQPWSRARAGRCRGWVRDDFDAAFGEALGLHELTPDVFETARTELAYGERLRRAGRRVDARVHLHRALGTFADLGAEPWAALAAAELALTGERVPDRPIGGVAALTPQELQVALLLAEGRTTREAAAALFLSPKTVEYHLRKVYMKLGIRSRAALAEVLADA
jgi:DNA-binding CsgD family transcriptional regulator/tetratricopeptide (TPR) repeat protein